MHPPLAAMGMIRLIFSGIVVLILWGAPASATHDLTTTTTNTNTCSNPYLTGTVTANGSPYTKTTGSVSVSCKSGQSWAYDWASLDSTGTYKICASSNTYGPCGSYYSGTSFTSCEVNAMPNWEDGNTLAASPRQSVSINCSGTTTKDLALASKSKTIVLSLSAGGSPITSGMNCSCNSYSTGTYSTSSSSGTVTSDGTCSVKVTEGTYNCSAWCSSGDCLYGRYPSAEVTVGANDTTKSASLEFTLKNKKIECTVKSGQTVITSGIFLSCYQDYSGGMTGGTAATGGMGCNSSSPSSNGIFSCSVGAGTYRCSASCNYSSSSTCDYSNYPQTTVTVKETDTTVPCSLAFTVKDKLLRVQVLAGVRAITSGVRVYVSERGGGWASSSIDQTTNGLFQTQVGTGRYSVSGSCSTMSGSCNISGYPSIDVDIGENDTTVDVTLVFLENDATISGIVTDGTRGISNAYVNIYSTSVSSGSGIGGSILAFALKDTHDGTASTRSSTTVSSYTTTDSSGAFQARVPAGTYTVSVSPPADQRDLGQASLQVIAKANATTAVNLTLSKKSAVIRGRVTDASGSGISGVNISGWNYGGMSGTSDWFNATTDSSGDYSANVVEGITYNISAYYMSRSYTATICNQSNEGERTVRATSTPQTVNFTYPSCDCTLTLNAVDASGALLTSIYGGVTCKLSTTPSNTPWQGLWGSLSGGTGTLNVQSGVSYTCSPYFWDNSFIQEGDETVTCSGGSAVVNFGMLDLDATITGSFEVDGETVTLDQFSYLSVNASLDGINSTRPCTTSSTRFTCKVSEGRWCLGYWIDPASDYASSSAGTSTSCEDISSGETVTKNLSLLRSGTILIHVTNSDETDRENAWVEATPFSNRDRGANASQRMYSSNSCMTGSDGTCEINVGAARTGARYYVNVYIPYYMRSEQNLLMPEEVVVEVLPGGEVQADTLSFQSPDGSSLITVLEGSSTSALTLGGSRKRSVLNDTEASPVAHAKVDCFANGGAAFQVETDETGTATCPCSTGDTWKAIANNMVASSLWLSEATDITCATDGSGTALLTLNNLATVPEGKSVKSTDPANESITIELSDGFSFFCPVGAVKTEGEATCTVDPTVTPSQSGRRPASFYGYSVNCLDENNAPIVQLAGNCSFVVPCNQKQVENLGQSLDSIEMAYFDDSAGAYNVVETAVIDQGESGSSCKITYEQDHLTDYVVVGNGNLLGLTGEEAGEEANEQGDAEETGASATGATAACGGCYAMNSTLTWDDRIFWLILILSFGLWRALRRDLRSFQ